MSETVVRGTFGARSILLLIAIIMFVLVAFGVAIPVVNLGWLGLAFFAASFFL